MDNRYLQDGETYTPPKSSSPASTAKKSFNRFKDSMPDKISSIQGKLQALPDKFPQVAETLLTAQERAQEQLAKLPDRIQTAQEQIAKLPDRIPKVARSTATSPPISPISAPPQASMLMKAPSRSDPAYDPNLAALAGKILYRSGYDPESGGPLLILCAASFPDAKQVDYNKLLPYVLSVLPGDEELGPEEEGGGYSVVFFSGGGGMPGTGGGGGGSGGASQGNRPSWAWTLQAYHLLGRAVRKRIRKLWVVHEKAWVRIIFEMMAGVVSTKFRKKVVHLNSLSDLAMHLDITSLLIPPAVYFHDRKLSPTINLPTPPPLVFGYPPFHTSSNPPRVGENMPLPQVLVDTTSYIRSSCLHVEGLFRVPPHAVLLDILREAFDRGQYLRLEQWGPHTSAALIKLYYRSLPEPIFPVQFYDILMTFSPTTAVDDEERLENEYIFPKIKQLLDSEEKGLPKASRVLLLKHLLPLLAIVAQNCAVNKMTPKNLAVCVAASLIRSDDMMADAKASSGVRKFIELGIERIEELAPKVPGRRTVEHGRHSSNSSEVNLGIKPPVPTTPPPPYTSGKQIQRKKVPGIEGREGDGGVVAPRKPVSGSSRLSLDGQTLVDTDEYKPQLSSPQQPQLAILTPPPMVYQRGSVPSSTTSSITPTQSSDPQEAPQGGIVLRRKASLQALAAAGGDETAGTLSKGPSYSSSSNNLSPHHAQSQSPSFLTRSLSVSSPMPPRVVRRAVSSSFLPSATSFSPSVNNLSTSPSSSVAAIASSLNRAQFNPNPMSRRDTISPTAPPIARAKTEHSVGNRSRAGTFVELERRPPVVERTVPVVGSGLVEELRALYEERAKGVEVLVKAGQRGSVKGRWREHQS